MGCRDATNTEARKGKGGRVWYGRGGARRPSKGFKGYKGKKPRRKPSQTAPALGEDVHTKAIDICILTWNVDGFRDKERRVVILSCLLQWGVDIAVLTESHLRDEDIFYDPPGADGDESRRIYKIKMDDFYIANWHNRGSQEIPIG